MAITAKVITTSGRNQAYFTRLAKAAAVYVGIPQGERDTEGRLIAQRAFWNEFGTLFTPERSFLRATLRQHENKYVRLMANLLREGRTIEEALEYLGLVVVDDVNERINSNIEPPLAASTVAKKKKLKAPYLALVATGEMQRAITSQVVSGGRV